MAHSVETKVLIAGYRAAVDRFMKARQGHDPHLAFHPLFEALNWAVAIEDQAPAELGRLKSEDRQLLVAVRYARNRIHHQWADALKYTNGAVLSELTLPISLFEWQWRPVGEIPQAKKAQHNTGAAEYTSALADRPARLTLTRLRRIYDDIDGP